ncbi:MAG: hypothetical protein P4L50_14105 [Anaerolineaceae bacterium]|nr:hypothetical protein [Anaerolineaceae bacterium]
MLRRLENLTESKSIIGGLTLIVWITYSLLGPGGDFFKAYRDLVLNPQNLISTFSHPITFNPPWLAPILAPMITMPGKAGYILFTGMTVLMLLYSARMLGGKSICLLISAQLFWILWWGQIDGLPVLGIAIGWLALQEKSWKKMVLALFLAALKPQMSFFPMIAMWWWLEKERWKAVGVFVIIITVSMVIYGPWPIWFVENIVKLSHSNFYGPWNSSIGIWALPLLIPALALKLNRQQRILALTASGILISPYMPYYSTILLFCFPIPWWSGLFAIIGYFPSVLGTAIVWNGITLLPISVLAWLYMPQLRALVLSLRHGKTIQADTLGR